jgi:hypothetical protein
MPGTRLTAPKVPRWNSLDTVCYGARAPQVGRLRRLPLSDPQSGSPQSERCRFESGAVHVDPIALTLKSTRAYPRFKRTLGNANHLLITILVGLDAVKSGHASLPEEFATTWNPVDSRASALRSREFALKSSMAWSVDALDAYRQQVTSEKYPYFSDPERVSINAENGLRLRFRTIAELRGALPAPEADMTELMIVWRNNLVHSSARISIPSDVSKRLLTDGQLLASAYRNLDIERTIASIENGSPPTFKEVAAFIAAANRFVQRIDRAIVAQADLDACLWAALATHVADDPIRRCRSIWVPDPEQRRNSILQLVQTLGFASGGTQTVSDQLSAELMSWTPKDARRELSQSRKPPYMSV